MIKKNILKFLFHYKIYASVYNVNIKGKSGCDDRYQEENTGFANKNFIAADL